MDILGPFQVSTTNGIQTTFNIASPRRLVMMSVVGEPNNSENTPLETNPEILLLTMFATSTHGAILGYFQSLPVGDVIKSKPGENGAVGKILFPRTDVYTITGNESFGRTYDQYYVANETFPVLQHKANPVPQLIYGTVTMYIDNYDPGTAPEGQFVNVCLGFE